jgi:hypothetical protein
MKIPARYLLFIAGLAILAGVLTGCASGQRRLQASGAPIQTRRVESPPSGLAPAIETATAFPSTTPTQVAISSEDAQEQDLLYLIERLNEANRAGDPFNDLP